MADVKLVTKFVDLGSTGGYGFGLYGFRNIGGSFGTFGTLSETANGSSNTTTSYLYSTSTDIKEVYWADQATDTVYFTLDGNRSNSSLIWTKLKIGSTTFTRSTASYSYNSSTNRTTWSWATSTNPFGSTTNGTDVSIEVIYDANTGHTSSISATTLTATSTSDVTYALSNASSSQKYRLIKSSGTIASGGGAGTVIDSRTGGGNLIFDYSNNELPPAGSSATYQLQVSGPYVSDTETESGFWINTTGQSNSITITREAAQEEDTTPNDFSFTDFTNVARSTTQTSSTITVGGLSTGTSVTVSVTGGTYSKNSGSYTSSNGTASNGDTFSVRHTSSASFSTDTNTTLTIGNKDDTFTTTTLAADTVPDAFSFTDVTDAPLSAQQTSNEITVAGLNTSTTVSITGGTYSKNSGSYTSSNGTASNGDTFSVRHTTSSSYSTPTNTELNIGGVTDTWSTTTIAQGSTQTGGGGGSSTGSGSYGIEVYGPDGTTVVWGSNVRQTNMVVYDLITLAASSTQTYTCADANDDTKVIVSVAIPSYLAGPYYQGLYGNLVVTTSSSGISVQNTNGTNSLTVQVVAVRIA